MATLHIFLSYFFLHWGDFAYFSGGLMVPGMGQRSE